MKIILALITALLLSTSAWANVNNATPLFNQYTCNSSTIQFPYAFPITASSDMTVYLTDTSGTTTQLSSSVFSVDTTNLWVNYPLVGSPCTTNYLITLRPSTPQTQTTTYGTRTPFTATAVGTSLDKLTLISQQLQSQINRTFLQPANVTTQVTFPSSNPGYLIGWNGSGVLANINNPSAVAQWSLSGANISYNIGNVSTINNISAAYFNGIHNGDINWPGVTSLLKSANVNWTDINGNVTINTGSINWPSINSIAKMNYGGINWPSTNIFPTSSTGNLGIGSSNPGQLLDVQGTARMTGLIVLNSIYNYGTSSSTFNTQTTALKIAFGSLTAASPQTITNLPFTSSTSYVVMAVNVSTSNAKTVNVIQSSGAQFILYPSTANDVENWIAIGT